MIQLNYSLTESVEGKTYMSKKIISILCVILLLLSIIACSRGEDSSAIGNGVSENEIFKEIVYTNTPDITPELYIQFDVNPSVGFYVDKENSYPVCGVVYNNMDAKEMLEGVNLVDIPLADAYAALYFNFYRAGYYTEDESGRHIDINTTYYNVGKSLGDNEYELIPVQDTSLDENIEKIAECLDLITEVGATKVNSGDGLQADFMDDNHSPEYDNLVEYFNTNGNLPDTENNPENNERQSHFEACPECGGNGFETATCDKCGGTGTAECELCNGTGWLACDLCDGNGYMMCTDCAVPGKEPDVKGNGLCNGCNGTGICKYCGGAGCAECDYQTGVTCKGCAGSGICGHCNGTGISRTCPRCFGHFGQMVCNGCSGEGQCNCPRCNGEGKIGDAPCHVCGGSGQMEVFD